MGGTGSISAQVTLASAFAFNGEIPGGSPAIRKHTTLLSTKHKIVFS